jgi:hypothetical protein
MLSFLTHTLNNSLGTAPEMVRQTIRLLGDQYQKILPIIKRLTTSFLYLPLFLSLKTYYKPSNNTLLNQKHFDYLGKLTVKVKTPLS